MKLVVLSDTHNYNLSKLNIPDGDVLIHCGDATGTGHFNEWLNFTKQWNKLPHKHKIYIPGNHDFFKQLEQVIKGLFENTHILIDEQVVINGVKFYGTPWCPKFGNWAWMTSEIDLYERFKRIPEDTNVLITHGPPYGILDKNIDGKICGSYALKKIIDELPNLRYNLFGHIHESYGSTEIDSIIFYNASIMNEKYKPINKPWIINYE